MADPPRLAVPESDLAADLVLGHDLGVVLGGDGRAVDHRGVEDEAAALVGHVQTESVGPRKMRKVWILHLIRKHLRKARSPTEI